MRKFLLSLLILPLGGCMWVCRVPVPVVEQFSEAGECTNRVWRSMVTDVRYKGGTNNVLWCYYPTIKIRIEPWRGYVKPIDPSLKGRDLYEAQVGEARVPAEWTEVKGEKPPVACAYTTVLPTETGDYVFATCPCCTNRLFVMEIKYRK